MRIPLYVRQHPIIVALLAALGVGLLAFSYTVGKTYDMAVYLGVMLVSAVAVDILASRLSSSLSGFRIKNPASELKVILLLQCAMLAISIVRFQVFTDWPGTPGLIKLPLLLFLLLLLFPILLVVAFFKWKYRAGEIGLGVRSWWLGLVVVAIFAVAGFLLLPQKMHFAEMYNEMGLVQMVLMGFIMAAFSEEITRFFVQTRVGAVLRNNAAGWLIGSTLWAFLHLPNFYSQSNGQFFSAVWAVLAILPIGLLWGFMTHRTKSIFPAVLVHGTNLWGFHDF